MSAADLAVGPARPAAAPVLAAPSLVMLAIVVPFLRYHEYSLLLPESIILLAGTAAVGAAAGLLAYLRPRTLGPAVSILVIGLYCLYRPELIDGILPALNPFAAAAVMTGIVLVVAGLCWALERHLNQFVIAVFGTIVVATLLLPTETGGEPRQSGRLPARLNDLPPVVHVVLDEHIGVAGLPRQAEGASGAAAALQSTYGDFALFARAYSRFAETQYALASLMNGEAGAEAGRLVAERGVGYVLESNAWFEQLKGQGYAIRVYQSEWLDMCGASGLVDTCYTYPLYSPNPVQRSALSIWARLRVLWAKLSHIGKVPQLSPLASMEALRQFEADIAEAPRGVAYVVHLLIPHFGYMYDRDCRLTDPGRWDDSGPLDDEVRNSPSQWLARYRIYHDQLVCTSERMAGLFARLKQLGIYDEATIVVHGDHGSRIAERPFRGPAIEALSDRDLLDHYSTLLAVKAPGLAPGVVPEPVLLQKAFAQRFLEGGLKAEIPPGEVLHRVDVSSFAPRVLHWPAVPPDRPLPEGPGAATALSKPGS